MPANHRHVLMILALALCLWPAAADAEGPTIAPTAMVAAANPHAAQAGLDILKAGGSAIDAAIAAQMVLGLVEPQSSGIGGGAFLLYYDAKTGAIESFDGRETAPSQATESLFVGADGEPMAWPDAAVGGLPVGAPGLLRMLELAHRNHGNLAWSKLFQPAIDLAKRGFQVSPRLETLIAANPDLAHFDAARAYFYEPDGSPKRAGATLVNDAYAETLRTIAQNGAQALYEGDIARDIVAAVRASPVNPGLLSEADLAGYKAKRRTPVCGLYRLYVVCGMGPPSSGGLTTLQILGLIERFDMASFKPGSVEAVHLVSEASRLAFADRNQFMADSDFVAVPVEGLIDPGYLAERSALIHLDRSMGQAAPGAPPGSNRRAYAEGVSHEQFSTSHLVVVDAEGNAVSLTTSIERAFGSRLMVRGFLLNNQLTDFSFRAEENREPIANRVEPGKRPRSSMSPTIVFDPEGHFLLAVGSPGGSRIIGFVTQTVIAVLDWGLDVQTAVALPHYVNRNGATELEAGTTIEAIAPELESLGHEVKITPLNSGLHAVRVVPNGLEGGADPRREGVALGY